MMKVEGVGVGWQKETRKDGFELGDRGLKLSALAVTTKQINHGNLQGCRSMVGQ
jgi:hypothetical protein